MEVTFGVDNSEEEARTAAEPTELDQKLDLALQSLDALVGPQASAASAVAVQTVMHRAQEHSAHLMQGRTRNYAQVLLDDVRELYHKDPAEARSLLEFSSPSDEQCFVEHITDERGRLTGLSLLNSILRHGLRGPVMVLAFNDGQEDLPPVDYLLRGSVAPVDCLGQRVANYLDCMLRMNHIATSTVLQHDHGEITLLKFIQRWLSRMRTSDIVVKGPEFNSCTCEYRSPKQVLQLSDNVYKLQQIKARTRVNSTLWVRDDSSVLEQVAIGSRWAVDRQLFQQLIDIATCPVPDVHELYEAARAAENDIGLLPEVYRMECTPVAVPDYGLHRGERSE